MAECPLSRDDILEMIAANDNYVVSVVKTATGFTVILRDGMEWSVPIEEHDVDFTETETSYIITIDNVPHVIKKCYRNLVDCDGNYIDPCLDRIVTCDNLESEGFIKDVCTNASLIGDGTPGNCLAVDWDYLCSAAETITTAPTGTNTIVCTPSGVKKIDIDNLYGVDWDELCSAAETINEVPGTGADVIICTDAGLKKIDIDEIGGWNGCFDNVPDIGTICGATERLLLVNDNGCRRLVRASEASMQFASGGFYAVAGHLPADTTGFTIPDNFPTPNLYYSQGDFQTDGGTNPNDRSGLDEAKIQNSRVARAEFSNPCQQRFRVDILGDFVREADANIAYIKNMALAMRYKKDSDPWFYTYHAGSGTVTTVGKRYAISGNYSVNFNITIPAGNIQLELFYIAPAYDAVSPGHARLTANTYTPGYGGASPMFTLTRI